MLDVGKARDKRDIEYFQDALKRLNTEYKAIFG